MPFFDRKSAVVSRQKPTGPIIDYPTCSDWSCDDDYDWESVGPDDEDYAAIKRERDIAYRHEPRSEWELRLRSERNRLSDGDPLWWGKSITQP